MQHPPKLIAIHGLKGSGKDLTASMLMRYVENSIEFSFGRKLKKICAEAFELPLHVFYSEELKETPTVRDGLSPRQMMTGMDKPLKDAFGQNFFAKSLIRVWEDALRHDQTLVVSDLRFPVERDVCDRLGALVVHIQRPPTGLYSDFSHASEAGLPVMPGDFVIDNSSDRTNLLMQVRSLVLHIWGSDALRRYPFVPPEC